MYENIVIEGFKGITELAINDFRQFNILVGENECGKTRILEYLFVSCLQQNRNFVEPYPDWDNLTCNNLVKSNQNMILKTLQKIDCELESLEILPPDDFSYRKKTNSEAIFSLCSLGSGQARLLDILVAIVNTRGGGVVFIDEIENGFYHSSLKILWEAVYEAAREFNVQIFATTHSLECIKLFSLCHAELFPNEDNIRLYRIEREGDKFKAVQYDYKVLEASLESNWEMR